MEIYQITHVFFKTNIESNNMNRYLYYNISNLFKKCIENNIYYNKCYNLCTVIGSLSSEISVMNEFRFI